MKKFKTFALNTRGRDFVVGDIHGAYDLVIQGMRQVKFNRNVDRLFSVGDLIDRGTGSYRALEFLAQPYVHAVRGNHDDDFSGMSLEEMRILGSINWNGMAWTIEASDEKLLAIKKRFSELPVALQVQTSRGTVGMVHGDVPAGMTWQEFIVALEEGDDGVLTSALTGRKRIQTKNEDGVFGIDRLFVGHTVQWEGPRRFGNVYAIDTGACFRELDEGRGGLTMTALTAVTEVLVNKRAEPLEKVASFEEVSEAPFGNYSVQAQR